MEVLPIIISALRIVALVCLLIVFLGFLKIERIKEERLMKNYEHISRLLAIVQTQESQIDSVHESISLLRKEMEELLNNVKRVCDDSKNKSDNTDNS